MITGSWVKPTPLTQLTGFPLNLACSAKRFKKDGYRQRNVRDFCNQPKAHSGLPGYAHETIAVNVTWMKRGFNTCQTVKRIAARTHLSSTVSHIQPVSSKVRHILAHFCTFWPTLGTPLGQWR